MADDASATGLIDYFLFNLPETMERQVTTWVRSTEGYVNLSTRVDRDCGAGASLSSARFNLLLAIMRNMTKLIFKSYKAIPARYFRVIRKLSIANV